jgi:hypothetical protein
VYGTVTNLQILASTAARFVAFEVFKAVKVLMDVFLFVTPCSVVVGYGRLEGPCSIHLQGEVIYFKAAKLNVAILQQHYTAS